MPENGNLAVFFAHGFEEIEALTVVDLARRADLPCAMIAVSDDLSVTGSHGITVSCDITIDDADLSTYDALVLPGGMPGTLGLKANQVLAQALRAQVEADKLVAAICAAPTVLAELGLLKGRRATCYPNMVDVLAQHGAILSDGSVVIDDKIITSRGMGTAIDFGLALVEYFKASTAARELSDAIVYSEK